jgi:SAM-dependent methyltransferase
VPDDVVVRFVDRWVPDENRSLFPELVEIGADGGFVEPDIVADFDTERLGPVESSSADFVICSHVLEHLAEPLGFLEEVYRVLRPGGVALVLLPDRRTTFDRDRPPTPLAHLADEHRRGVVEVDDEHLVEFLTLAGEGASYLGVPEDVTERQRFFDWHRRRSIHVHCWSEEEFPAVIAHCISHLDQAWELVDLLTVAEEGPGGIEFGYVLRRSTRASDAEVAARRFLSDWASAFADRSAVDQALVSTLAASPPTGMPTSSEPAPAAPDPSPGRRWWSGLRRRSASSA